MIKTVNEIRHIFLNYFMKQGHQVIASSALVPKNDHSILFTNAGMVQFKNIFIGQERAKYLRIVTCQKCFRASGKHNDLENVGRSLRHNTFFEMLGNFSFGDYFKERAIVFAWELLTQGYGLNPNKLWVSIHERDDEAYKLWQSEVGVKLERIVRLGDVDNFWSMADIGPCGPCSEIYIDQGSAVGCGQHDCSISCNCDRFLEIWNLVFMQFNRDINGVMTSLPKFSIDTGMGLERIASVIYGKYSNYDTELFVPILDKICEFANKVYCGVMSDNDISLRIIADHIRSCYFLISEGVMPSNEERGYILRHIIRRACYHGNKLGLTKPFLYILVEVVADQMGSIYQSLYSIETIKKVILTEEKRFNQTLDIGSRLFNDVIIKAKAELKKIIDGNVIFKLYDTYGFPLDLSISLAKEEGFIVDEVSLNQSMEIQRERSRMSWKSKGIKEEFVPSYLADLSVSGIISSFIGYDRLQINSNAAFILLQGRIKSRISFGEKGELITYITPFYGESGGQVGDIGWIIGPHGKAKVINTSRPVLEYIVHHIEIVDGYILVGDQLSLEVDINFRKATTINHTAVHILHSILRQQLGEHVRQAGSLVTFDRLRFDFNHFQPITYQEIQEIERRVNIIIQNNIKLVTRVMNIDQAVDYGAMALFEESYSEKVRLVEIPGISKELCGGTHIDRTGDIGLFKVITQSSIGAGLRRLEATTGSIALEKVLVMEDEILELERILKVDRLKLCERVIQLQLYLKKEEREVTRLKNRLLKFDFQELLSKIELINGIKMLVGRVEADSSKNLREISDMLRNKIKTGVIILGAVINKRALLLCVVTNDLVERYNAEKIINKISSFTGGSGGGSSTLAQGGGRNYVNIDHALAQAVKLLHQCEEN